MINLSNNMKKFLLTLCLVFVFGFSVVGTTALAFSDGTPDLEFVNNLGSGFSNVASVNKIVVLSDNKMLIGGWFQSFNGTNINALIKLNQEGFPETSFNNNIGTKFNQYANIKDIAVQSDGKIIVVGTFSGFNGNTSRKYLMRLNSDGTEDAAFNNNLGNSFNGPLYAVAIASNGDILVGGNFSEFNNQPRNNIVKLKSTGLEDVSFYNNLGVAFNNRINEITIDQNNNIYIGGNFSSFNFKTRNHLVKLSLNGQEDINFATNFDSVLYKDNLGIIYSIVNLPQSVLIAGAGLRTSQELRNFIFKLNLDGTKDTSFAQQPLFGFNAGILDLAVQGDGKIIAGGFFNSSQGYSTPNRLIRLTASGYLDSTFNFNIGSGANSNSVNTLGIQTTGKVLVGGGFSSFDTTGSKALIRLTTGIYLPPVVNLSTTTPNVNTGGYTGLSWNVTGDASSCVGTSSPSVLIWNGNKTPIGSGSQNGIGPINQETTFTLTCTGPGGEGSDTEIITVNPNAPTINFYATPSSVTATNKTTTLHWSVEDATSCSASSTPSTTWNGSRTFATTEKTENVTLNNPTTFKLNCTGPGGDSEASVSVGILSLPNFNFTASSPVAYENATYITWDSVTNATSCSASSNNANSNWSGSVSTNGGSKFSNLLTQNTIFTLSCTGSGGTTTKDVEVKVGPKITLNANPTDIAKGGGTDLTWTTLNATSCTASSVPSSSWNGSKSINSSSPEKVLNINENIEFKLTCENSGGVSASAVVLVKVTPVPTVLFSANPTKVLPGGFADLTLETTNADSCIASSNPSTTWVGNKPINQIHTERVLGINAKTTFTVVCSSLGGVISREVVVDLIAEKLTFNNTKVLRDSSTGQYKTTLSWVLTNLTNCTASTLNPDNGLNWGGNIPDSPTSNSKSNVLVKAPDTNNRNEKNQYILTCFGKSSNKKVEASLFLDINDLASSGVGIPDYEEN